MKETIYQTFKQGSKTYFYSSLFFSGQTKEDVFTLYAFVRKADDYVDTIPQRKDEFIKLKNNYHRGLEGESSGDVVVDSFVELVRRMKFKRDWVEAFLWSMESDFTKREYETMEELKRYLYGSAEVVGLMMAKILDLPVESYSAARHLGRSMQYINFVRDIEEDLALGRTYIPLEDLESFGVTSLRYEDIIKNPAGFEALIHSQTKRYLSWQIKAERGFAYIPKKYLIPIKTASDMYKWTAQQIDQNPYSIYRRKVKPSILRILLDAAYNALNIMA